MNQDPIRAVLDNLDRNQDEYTKAACDALRAVLDVCDRSATSPWPLDAQDIRRAIAFQFGVAET